MPSVPMLPVLRAPTRYERLVFALRHKWPQSYVHARLTHNDRLDAAIQRMSPQDALCALQAESPYEAGA